MYTNDERFAILHTPGSNTWTLQIKFVQRRDHGMYECQVSITIFIVSFKCILPHHIIYTIYMMCYVFLLKKNAFKYPSSPLLTLFRLAILLFFHFFPQIYFVCVTFGTSSGFFYLFVSEERCLMFLKGVNCNMGNILLYPPVKYTKRILIENEPKISIYQQRILLNAFFKLKLIIIWKWMQFWYFYN
jgi:hypothetical protein